MLRDLLNFIKSFKKRFLLYYVVVLSASIFGSFPLLLVKLCAFSVFVVSSALFLPIVISYFTSVFKQFTLHKRRVKIPIPVDILDLARKAGVTIKEVGIVKMNNAYVMGRSLVLGMELLEMLNRDELLAVVAHEFGHIKRRHLIIRGISACSFIVILMFSWYNFHSPIFISELMTQIILTVILNIAGFAFLLVILIPINWITEIDADKFAARLVGKEHIKSALLKLVDVKKLEEPSETHPSVAERLRKIDKDCQSQGWLSFFKNLFL